MEDPLGIFEPEILTITDSTGREMELQLLTAFSMEEKKYMAFIPTHDSEDELINLEVDMSEYDVNGMIVFRLEEDENNEDILIRLVDPDEIDEVQEFMESGMESSNPMDGI